MPSRTQHGPRGRVTACLQSQDLRPQYTKGVLSTESILPGNGLLARTSYALSKTPSCWLQ